MRRAVARGRMFPQSYSTDRRYGRLSLKAIGLFPLMWSNADDQGRLCGDPEEIKYAVCPNIDHITKLDIPGLLKELQDNNLILCYDTPKSAAIQLLDWWDANQKMQWAWPSEYPPPDGWQDRLRYKKDALTVAEANWKVSGEKGNGTQVSHPQVSGEVSGELSGERFSDSPKVKQTKTITRTRRGRGRGNSPERSGEKPSPSPTGSCTDNLEILHRLTSCFKREWGKVPADRPYKIIPREPDSRESTQLRDLAKEISAAGGCPLETVDEAFRDAAGRPDKMHISYARAIILDRLGLPRNRSP